MTPVVLIGMMIATALVLAITWIEPRVLGGPAPPKAAGVGGSKEAAPDGAATERALGPVREGEERPSRVEQRARHAA